MRACTNLAEQIFAHYINVSVHFVFTKLFHQITPYLIITQVGVNFFMCTHKNGHSAPLYFCTDVAQYPFVLLCICHCTHMSLYTHGILPICPCTHMSLYSYVLLPICSCTHMLRCLYVLYPTQGGLN